MRRRAAAKARYPDRTFFRHTNKDNTMTTVNATPEAMKKEVSEFYGGIARAQTASGCGPGSACCGVSPSATMSESYEGQEGYVADADLGLGCGVPTEFADLRSGHTVLDLGSGAGNDAF